MKTLFCLCAASLFLTSCASRNAPQVNAGNGSNAAVQAGTGENGLRTANSPQNPYDQPGALPANSGGTDAGRIGTDPRYEPVR